MAKHHELLTVVLAFAGTAVAIWAVRSQNTIARELATQQNFVQFYQQWESDAMQYRRSRLAAALLEKEIPENLDDSPLVFLETLSSATKRGLVDRELVWTTFSIDLTSYWAAAQPYVTKNREKEKCACLFEELEGLSKQFLFEETRKRGEESSLIGRDAGSIRHFLEWERKRKLPEVDSSEGTLK